MAYSTVELAQLFLKRTTIGYTLTLTEKQTKWLRDVYKRELNLHFHYIVSGEVIISGYTIDFGDGNGMATVMNGIKPAYLSATPKALTYKEECEAYIRSLDDEFDWENASELLYAVGLDLDEVKFNIEAQQKRRANFMHNHQSYQRVY